MIYRVNTTISKSEQVVFEEINRVILKFGKAQGTQNSQNNLENAQGWRTITCLIISQTFGIIYPKTFRRKAKSR